MKTVWLPIAVVLIAGFIICLSGCGVKEDIGSPETEAAEETKKDIPLYDGEPGEKIGDVRINSKDGAEMVWVPAGEFLMGSTDEEIAQLLKENPGWKADWFAREKPQRKVNLDGYWIYKNPVTVAQYRKFCEATGRKMRDAPTWGWKDDHPIVNVTWHDATAYAKWAGGRLPTEAQWEKAARGTDGRRYPWGNDWPPPKGAGNFADKALTREAPELAKALSEAGFPPLSDYDDGYAYTSPVGSFPAGASPYGALDMAGNVWEWCEDWYGKDYYKSAPLTNPQGPGSGSYRVVRGGGWDSGGYCRSAARDGLDPDGWDSGGGFRLVRSGG
jgi:formylglycine-generating enzyme required for sulfatase activity